jgi:membrane-bound ClpP family serine protease
MLNVHFGRQDLASTFKTYVAWGLLPEAYGNFGPIKGSLIIGIVLGLLFAWAECYTTHKPLLSAEGFVAFVIFLILANSFEMVSSVMVTAMFQAVVPVIVACAPFVRLRTVVRPTDSGSGA